MDVVTVDLQSVVQADRPVVEEGEEEDDPARIQDEVVARMRVISPDPGDRAEVDLCLVQRERQVELRKVRVNPNWDQRRVLRDDGAEVGVDSGPNLSGERVGQDKVGGR